MATKRGKNIMSSCIETFSCSRQIEKRSCQLEWEINYINLVTNDTEIIGPLFPPGETNDTQFSITILKRNTWDPKRCIHVPTFYFKLIAKGQLPLNTFYSFCFKPHNYPLKAVTFNGKIENDVIFGNVEIDQIWDKKDWLNVKVNHKATVTCEVWIIGSFNNIPKEITLKYADDEDSVLLNNSVHQEEEFHDFVFNVQDKKFGVPKVLLALESPVFASMFRTNMKERLNSSATIKDVDPRIFEKMLNFIYHQKISKDELKTSVIDLFSVAHKYQINKLVQICLKFLYDDFMSKDNKETILNIANQYNIPELKEKALKY